MDQPLTDRRIDARVSPAGATRATLRPGCVALLVDVSPGGALVQARSPLRPGARAHLQLVTTAQTFAIAAHVLRCAVWSLDPSDGVLYRGALKFDHRCDVFWAETTPSGSAVPGPGTSGDTQEGNAIPGGERQAAASSRRSAK